MAASYGVDRFSFDSVDEADKLMKYIPGCSVYIRLSVPNEGSEWPLSKKFGVELDDALELLLYAGEKGLNPAGITFHVGSQCTNMYSWNIALDKAKALWDMAAKKGLKLKLLNIGVVVREALKHKSVEKIYFIEIDEEVINVSRKFFPV